MLYSCKSFFLYHCLLSYVSRSSKSTDKLSEISTHIRTQVNIMTTPQPGTQRNRVSVPGRGKMFLYLRSGQTDYGAHTVHSSIGTGEVFFAKWREKLESNHLPTSTVGDKIEGSRILILKYLT